MRTAQEPLWKSSTASHPIKIHQRIFVWFGCDSMVALALAHSHAAICSMVLLAHCDCMRSAPLSGLSNERESSLLLSACTQRNQFLCISCIVFTVYLGYDFFSTIWNSWARSEFEIRFRSSLFECDNPEMLGCHVWRLSFSVRFLSSKHTICIVVRMYPRYDVRKAK